MSQVEPRRIASRCPCLGDRSVKALPHPRSVSRQNQTIPLRRPMRGGSGRLATGRVWPVAPYRTAKDAPWLWDHRRLWVCGDQYLQLDHPLLHIQYVGNSKEECTYRWIVDTVHRIVHCMQSCRRTSTNHLLHIYSRTPMKN